VDGRTPARRELEQIREKITPGLSLYAEIRPQLVALAEKYAGTAEADDAKRLIEEVDTKYAALADEAMREAIRMADGLAAGGRYADAARAVRALQARFSDTEWFRTRGEKEMLAAIQKYEEPLVRQAAETIERARALLEEGRYAAARTTLSARWGWPLAQRQQGDEVLAEIAKKIEEFEAGRPDERVEEPGLVAYWRFDEGQGTQGADSSGNRHTATFHGNVTWAEGKVGGAVAFDGEKSFITVKRSELLKLGNKSFTIALWADNRQGRHMIANGKAGWKGWVMEGGGFVAGDRTHNVAHARLAGKSTHGGWVHQAVTYDATANKMIGYRNGEQTHTATPESQGDGLRNIDDGSAVTLGARQAGQYGP
jgi:hypothetical protein